MAAKLAHPTVEERLARGAEARDKADPSSHARWAPASGRKDAVALLEEQNATREPDLVPVRHGRMTVSPFTFYRGAAKVMAADLADTPRAGLDVQLCGDAHLSNFGGFASPERELLFDLNDFDETLPGPFEYDVKRMATSFTIAANHNGFAKADAKAATLASVEAYRTAMIGFGQSRTMDVWYAHMSEDDTLAIARATRTTKKADRRLARDEKNAIEKARTHDSRQALSKLGELVDGRYQIVSKPPILIPLRDLPPDFGRPAAELEEVLHQQFLAYRETLQDDHRRLLERFHLVDAARKVVGVGSVGTRAFIALLQGRDEMDPLFLQVKEATASVLEDHLPKSRFRQPGERVVQGQRMMQAASDIFLGWTKGVESDHRYYYWRQLRDMKVSVSIEAMSPAAMTLYARLCGWTLARAHARSGDPIALAEYLGRTDSFDRAIADFAKRYASQNEKDYEEFVAAIRSGRLQAVEGV